MTGLCYCPYFPPAFLENTTWRAFLALYLYYRKKRWFVWFPSYSYHLELSSDTVGIVIPLKEKKDSTIGLLFLKMTHTVYLI